jgi:septal ring factor EnvC (AmiA/AmiB activator)
MPQRDRSRTGQPPVVCYCPAAVAALSRATDELEQARSELQRHDPNWNAINAIRHASEQLRQTREFLERSRPDLEHRVEELLSQLEPAAKRIYDLVDLLDKSEVVWLKR